MSESPAWLAITGQGHSKTAAMHDWVVKNRLAITYSVRIGMDWKPKNRYNPIYRTYLITKLSVAG